MRKKTTLTSPPAPVAAEHDIKALDERVRRSRATVLGVTAELLDVYTEARGQALPDLDWFRALTKYKEAAATALLIKRGRRAEPLPDSLVRMEPALPRLLDEALTLLG